jgi:hypothetical protein
MKTMRCVLALLLTLALGASGCAALVGGAAVAGGYQYVEGQFKTDYRHPYERVYDATLASLQESNMPVSSAEKDVAGAKIKAKRADGTDVWVDLKRTGPEMTDATIRVGYLGDENASRAIANSIATKLGEEERQTGRGGK